MDAELAVNEYWVQPQFWEFCGHDSICGKTVRCLDGLNRQLASFQELLLQGMYI